MKSVAREEVRIFELQALGSAAKFDGTKGDGRLS
jgi:hypothetical protein